MLGMDGATAAVVARLRTALPTVLAGKRTALELTLQDLPDPVWIDVSAAVDPSSRVIDVNRFPMLYVAGTTTEPLTRRTADVGGVSYTATYQLTVVSYVVGHR